MSHEEIAPPRLSRAASFGLVAGVYVLAAVAGFAVAQVAGGSALEAAAWADLAATVVVFAGSFAVRNSSMYDAYWSVAPPLLVLFWANHAEALAASPGRTFAVTLAVWLWGVRLTANWMRGWRGLHEEDWRYADLRRLSGRLWWPLSLVGIHLFPTVQVFLGLLGAHAALLSSRPYGGLDVIAFGLCFAAVVIEHVGDAQLHDFLASKPPRQAVLRRGLWAYSRHPNYFGECLFWWGLWLFGVAGQPGWWWTAAGPLAITAMFAGVSIPMMERRMGSKRPAYSQVQREVSALVPWLPRGSGSG